MGRFGSLRSREYRIAIGVAIALATCTGMVVHAQAARSYHYKQIAVDITVQRNASIVVKETQTFAFTGVYHQADRTIPGDKIGAITDVSVVDDTTGQRYTGALTPLDKNDPASWGRFAVTESNGGTDIQWYYGLGSQEGAYDHTWTITYTVHGATAFYADHDELYWNLFTNYTVPVDLAEATVHLPEADTQPQAILYRSTAASYASDRPDDRTFHFVARDVQPREAVTIAVGWQKGMVSKQAYWADWFALYAWYLLAVLIVLGSIAFDIGYWFFMERFHKGRGTIIPEYEPPRKLPPVMAQLILKERLGKASWPATLVDLAVRGYVRIVKEHVEPHLGFAFLNKMFASEGYRVEKVKEYQDDHTVSAYEKELLATLFEANHSYFSTRELQKRLRSSPSAAQAFQKRMREVAKRAYAETTEVTGAYAIPLTAKEWQLYLGGAWSVARLLVIVGIVALAFGAPFFSAGSPTGAIVAVGLAVLVAGIGTVFSTKYNPRLNTDGFLLKDDIKGFKLYLKTAERYRLQNLTPDMFEKYLPYAMIFGIEKQWAKAFESMNLPAPQWYGTTGYPAGYAASGFSRSGTGSFSPSLFSASFATSFSSAFASSGAGGGASGGGGGAGGGGGGGGGGAS